MARIARVFTRKNKYTPEDADVYLGAPDLLTPEYDEVNVSCTFTWDKPKAERLADEWELRCKNVKVGGPAYGDPGGEFTPGLYVKHGYVKTSRGCIRKCPHCLVSSREGMIRELEIHDGALLMDNNILACSREHQAKVFEMLSHHRGVRFLGGLDVRLFTNWTFDMLEAIKKSINYFYIAYDVEAQREPFDAVVAELYRRGFSQNHIGCYVLVGYDGDTIEDADKRCEWVFSRGAVPFAMYYRGPDEMEQRKPRAWAEMVRNWTNLWLTFSNMKNNGLKYHNEFVRGRYAAK